MVLTLADAELARHAINEGRLDADRTLHEVGFASRYDPPEDISSHPWEIWTSFFYLMAMAYADLPEPTGNHQEFRADLRGGPILAMEVSVAIGEGGAAIAAQDVSGSSNARAVMRQQM